MAREVIISVSCNQCREEKGERVAAEIALVAVRVNDPDNPGKVRTVIRSLDACPEHLKTLTEALAMVEKHGSEFEEDEVGALTRAVKTESKVLENRNRDSFLCFTCPMPSPLKTNSRYTHARDVHGMKLDEVDYRPFDPAIDQLKVEII